MLPDVKSLEDTLVHLLAGQFRHALAADVKYLECLSCYRQHVLTTEQARSTETHSFQYQQFRNRKQDRKASQNKHNALCSA